MKTQPTEYELDRAEAHLKLARYLMSCADERGLTHGEKHHLQFVALREIQNAIRLITGDDHSTVLDRYENTNPIDAIGVIKDGTQF